MKTSELTGAALDWAVFEAEHGKPYEFTNAYKPSTDWEQGGPILEMERIAVGFLSWDPDNKRAAIWEAEHYEYGKRSRRQGPTPLIAAMRCYVAVNLGDEIKVPAEVENA